MSSPRARHRSCKIFVAAAFDAVGLDWRDHTKIDQTLFRPTEIMIRRGDASKAADKIDWQPKYKMDDVVRMMVQAAGEPDRQKGIKVPPPNAKC